MSNLTNPCLKTQVLNDSENLERELGEFKLVVSLPANQRVGLVVNDACTLRTSTPGVKFSLTDSGALSDTLTITETSTIYIANTTQNVLKANIFFTNKYNNRAVFNTSAASAGARIYTESYKDESSDWLKITSLRSSSNDADMIGTVHDLLGMYNAITIFLSGDTPETTEDWAHFTKCTNFRFGSNVSGDIVKLGACTALTNLAFGNSHCSGTIESFVQAQRANGRTTGSMTGNSTNTKSAVTFNGDRANAKGPLSWTATTITMNGVTIEA